MFLFRFFKHAKRIVCVYVCVSASSILADEKDLKREGYI